MSNPFKTRQILIALLAFFSLSCLHLRVKAQAVNIPYFNDFEGIAAPFTDSLVSGSTWQLGMPNYGSTVGTHSGINAWDIELNGPYQPSTISYLTTPFFNIGGNSNVMLSFWQNRNSETGWDGMRIEYNTDTVNWFILGNLGDPNAVNWYTSIAINSSGLPAWDGSSSGWIQSTYNLSSLAMSGNIRFRFVFTSDVSIETDGISLDDFSVYQLPQKDAGVSAIQNFPFLPTGATISTFNITVKNYGSTAFNSFSVSYKINNGAPLTVPSTFNLQPNSIVNITVPGFVVPAGQSTLCAYTTLLADSTPVNDTLCIDLYSLYPATVPYFNDFEGPTNEWVNYTNSANTSWELGLPNFGSTNSAHSGSACWDINLDSGYTANAICYLYSPIFSFNGIFNASLSFYQNRNTDIYDGVSLQSSTDGGNTWVLVGNFMDTTGLNWYNGYVSGFAYQFGWTGSSFSWQPSSIPLAYLNGADSVIFRFAFASGALPGTGFSIDDFNITIPSAIDAGITIINVPSITPAGTVISVVPVTVKNYGSQPLTSVTVAYTINAGAPTSAAFPVNILPGTDTILNLPGFTSPSGSYAICSYSSLVSDGNHVNDSTCKVSYGIPLVNVPFFDNFDNGNLGWGAESVMNPIDQWQIGNPVIGIPNAPFTAPMCVDININSIYYGPSLCYLYTPFFNFTNAVHPKLSFWHNNNTEINYDGMRIEWSLNNGPWYLLGTYLDTNAINWYNLSYIISSNLPAWSGGSLGWENSSYNLDVLGIPNGSIVQFRFVFTADQFNSANDGIAIDNFEISTLLAQDAALTGMLSPGTSVSAGASTPVEILIKNNGLQTLNALDIYYNANGTTQGPFTWTGSLATDSVESFVMPSFLPIPNTNQITIFTSWPADLNKYNDTISASFYGYYSVNVPYSIDFENGALGWDVYASPFANTQWELGKPSFGTTTGTHSGDSCWDVNLITECGNLANTILYTPVFNFSSGSNSRLSCWINYDTEPFADGFHIDYSTNGTTWQTLGIPNDPLGTNWYNGSIANNQPAWSISSQGWKNAVFNTSFLDGLPYVRMRFKFTTDFAISSVGASMDDFSITNSVGIQENTEHSFHIYPSPALDYLIVAIPVKYDHPTGIRISDITGRSVLWTNSPFFKNDQFRLNISSLKPGVYFIFVEMGGRVRKRMFVKG